MAAYQYRVVPFMGQANARDARSAERVSAQLKSLIDANVGEGWEFYRIDQIQVAVSPGCLGGLFGQRETMVALDQVIFRQEAG